MSSMTNYIWEIKKEPRAMEIKKLALETEADGSPLLSAEEGGMVRAPKKTRTL